MRPQGSQGRQKMRQDPLNMPIEILCAGNALGISICGCRCILERSWSQNSGCASTRSLKISGCKRWCHKDLRVLAPAAPALTHSLVHTVSSQDFRSFHFLSFFLAKTVQLKFFCEITTFTSRLLSFDKFFAPLLIFYDFKPNFLLEAGQILERSQWIQIL